MTDIDLLSEKALSPNGGATRHSPYPHGHSDLHQSTTSLSSGSHFETNSKEVAPHGSSFACHDGSVSVEELNERQAAGGFPVATASGPRSRDPFHAAPGHKGIVSTYPDSQNMGLRLGKLAPGES